MSHHSPMTLLRRRLAIVLAALLAIAMVPLASPAGAAPAPAPDISDACEAAESAGFTDIAGTGFEDYINCLAAFGVTTGTTATTYSPAVQVRRSQMALFYYRIGTLFDLEWDTTDAGFTDLGGLGDDFVDAINALANAGIVNGTTETTFDPQSRIRRSQMALFIDRFQEFATGFAYSDGLSGDDLFPDLGQLSDEARNAVNGIGSKGITQGDADGKYVPSGFVSRQQMAAFIVRHLVDNGLEVPEGDQSGIIIDIDTAAGQVIDYTVSTGDAVVEVEPGDGATFRYNGIPATEAVWTGVANVGDRVVFNLDTDTHNVIDQDPLTVGLLVGDALDVAGETTNLIEAFSGAEIESGIDLASDDGGNGSDIVYRVGNATVSPANFFNNISLGDILTIENYEDGDADTDTIYRLQNGGVTGVADVTMGGTIVVDIDSTAPDGFVGLGNDLAGNGVFELNDADATQRFFSDNAPQNFAGITAWLTDALADLGPGDYIRLTYTRSGNNDGGLETFVFSVVDAEDAEVEPGTISGVFIGGSIAPAGDEFQILVNGTVWTVEITSPPAGILVDGVITSTLELAGLVGDTEIEAGASVTVSVGNKAQIDSGTTTVEASEAGDLVIISNPS